MRTVAMVIRALGCVAIVLVATTLLPKPEVWAAEQGETRDFYSWLAELRGEASRRGVSERTLDAALAGVQPVERVVELDRKQPEFTQTFWQYLDKRVTPERVERGRQMMAEKGPLLKTITRRFGVQPRFLVAFWALESNFGDYTGDYPAAASLATLAFDERRSAFFREQLLALLQSIEDGDIPTDAKGSWAGALGQPQFMPTTYRRYAVDADGDARRDLWTSLADVFGSAANYLAASGWDKDHTWGREVRLPSGFDLSVSGLETEKPLVEWQRLGVRDADGHDLPVVDLLASLILPGGINGGPALLVYGNFRAIMAWNRSILYAVAVGHLSDRVDGGEPFRAVPPPNDVALSRSELMEIQSRLDQLGFDVGLADGVVGPKTRKAIREFQHDAKLPADGYPDTVLLKLVRQVSAE